MNWISTKDIVVHNAGDRLTFIRGNSESYIDVNLLTSAIAQQIANWEVLQTELLTEHTYVYFEVLGTGSGKRYDSGKAAVDWKAFRDTIEVTGKGPGNDSHEKCTALIQQAYWNSSIRVGAIRDTPYWWDDSIAEKRTHCNEIRRLTRAARATNVTREDIDNIKQ